MAMKKVFSGVSRFHSSASSLARTRIPTNIKLRPPIVPTINNLEIKDDHPLYQFFSGKKLIRSPEEIQSSGRHWSISELRRKSFEDLHCLWYVLLKERNVLGREYKIMQIVNPSNAEVYDHQSEQIRESMWRIKHVLHERMNTHEKLRDHFVQKREEYLAEFTKEYMESEDVTSEEWMGKLERMQFAYFGIVDEISLDLDINVDYILGIRYVGELVFNKFKTEDCEIQELRDITEHYAIFEEEPTLEGFNNGISKIKEYRESEVTIPKNKDIAVVELLIRSRIEQME